MAKNIVNINELATKGASGNFVPVEQDGRNGNIDWGAIESYGTPRTLSDVAGERPIVPTVSNSNIGEILSQEISQNIGIGRSQNVETGMIGKGDTDLSNYSTRLFGSPFQLLDSVDTRFPEVNSEVGSEYLRNFLANSPILYIKPGMPKYTGGEESTMLTALKEIEAGSRSRSGGGVGAAVATSIFKNLTSASNGAKLQKRMFGFRETYLEYMQFVDYMCRSVAILMGIPQMAAAGIIPGGTFVASGSGGASFQPFESIRWKDYRMSNRYVRTSIEQLKAIGGGLMNSAANALKSIFNKGSETQGALDVMRDKIANVQFMVTPVSFTEDLSNETGQSMIESMINGMSEGIGSEIAFITNSNVDAGMANDLIKFLGDVTGSVGNSLTQIAGPVTGGFAQNLFSGALKSLQGQKMIYPEIYKNSSASMDYNFTVTLSSPYGDPYNYYMNIVVPLMHLIALVAPRMLTSNTIASPFLVQAYIPGMCTCELGIIKNMSIVKNPKTNHVSIHGFPLTVEVNFTLHPLYRNISISPAHDPASFMYNETLNDYLANIAGLVPSIDTYMEQVGSMMQNAATYFKDGSMLEEFGSRYLNNAEDLFGF